MSSKKSTPRSSGPQGSKATTPGIPPPPSVVTLTSPAMVTGARPHGYRWQEPEALGTIWGRKGDPIDAWRQLVGAIVFFAVLWGLELVLIKTP